MGGKNKRSRGAEVRASRARSRVEARKRSGRASGTRSIPEPPRSASRRGREKEVACAAADTETREAGSVRGSEAGTLRASKAGEESRGAGGDKFFGRRKGSRPDSRVRNRPESQRKKRASFRAGCGKRKSRKSKKATDPCGEPGGAASGKRVTQGTKSGLRPARTAVFGALLVLSLGALLWTYTATGVLNVKNVEVKGNDILSEEYLRALSGITADTHLLKMNVKAVEKALMSEPYVAAVDVTRRFPGTVILEVCERRPSGAIAQNGRFALVDQEGMVLASVDEIPPGLVEIRDLQLSLLLPGNRVSGLEFAEVTSLLGSLPAPLREKASVVGLRSAVGLYLEADGTLVIYGEAESLSRKNSIALMALGALVQRYGSVEYIDVSFPDRPVIKPAS